MKKGLRPISQDALHVLDDIVYHEYGVPATVEECEELGRTCQKGGHVILHNHGLLTAASTIPGALRGLYMMERACELELISRQLGEEPVMIEDYIIQRAAQRMKQVRSDPNYGVMYFEALQRQIRKKGATEWCQ
jgi:ribulose-5-phosphate 4-epimerase/fuculose-1-phosphate aldolase